jgi:hypothetical protein
VPLSIATPSGLQSAYNAVARAEPNAPDGSHPNRSSPVIVVGTIKLTKQLRIPGNAVTLGDGNGGMLTWDGTEPPILFYSAVSNGATAGVRWKGVSINAPHARNLWEWDTSAHAGNAHDYTFEDCTFTTNEGTHLNLNGPGADGRGYYFTFRNIKITGTGQIARCDGAHANPMVLFDNIQCVNRQLTGPAFDLWNTSGAIVNCWLELTNTTVLSMHGAFSLIRWQNNYIEPHNGVPNGELVKVDGYNSALLADALYFIMPAQRVVASNGGQVIFTRTNDMTGEFFAGNAQIATTFLTGTCGVVHLGDSIDAYCRNLFLKHLKFRNLVGCQLTLLTGNGELTNPGSVTGTYTQPNSGTARVRARRPVITGCSNAMCTASPPAPRWPRTARSTAIASMTITSRPPPVWSIDLAERACSSTAPT